MLHWSTARNHAGKKYTTVLLLNTELDPADESAVRSMLERLPKAMPPDLTLDWRHFTEASVPLVRLLQARCIILSGQGTPLAEYPERAIMRFRSFLERVPVPVLGICGGHQLIALAFGGTVAPIRGTLIGASYEGLYRQRGYTEVTPWRGGTLFDGIAAPAVFWENHVEEVKALPPDFLRIAREKESPCQAMRHRTRPIFGVQFHPERFSSRHPAGRLLLRNFFALEV